MSEEVTIKLSPEIIAKIAEDIIGTSFKSVQAFVESLVMQKYPEFNEPVYTKEEEELIKERLRKLGYIE